MPFSRPTLPQIIERVIADMSSGLLGVDGAVLRRSLLGLLARAEAGAVHLLYGYMDWVARQVTPDTAEDEYLEAWARIFSLDRRDAEFARGSVTFTGEEGSGILSGVVLQGPDGVEYVTTASGVIAGGSVTLTVEARAAGTAGNLPTGTAVFLQSPVAGVNATATVAAPGLAGGTERETDEALRDRLLLRIRQPPQGGAESDYVLWALEVPGVTRVWPKPLGMGPGTVVVLFVTDDDPGGLIPSPGMVQQVQDHIDARRPVTADVYVMAPGTHVMDMTIQIEPNTPEVQQAVTAELEDLLMRQAEPGKTIYISKIREAVSIAAGEENSVVVVPSADVTPAAGEIVVLGTITFQAVP